MKITVLNGSPRQNGNTARMINIFRNAAEVVKENLELFGFELTEDEMEQITMLDRGEKHDWY